MALSSTGQRSSTRAASKAAAINIATIARKESGQANDIESNGSSKKRKRASTSTSASASASASTSSSSRKKTKKLTGREKTELKAKRSRERMGRNKNNTMCIHYSDEEVRAAQEKALQKSLKLVKALRGNTNVSKFNLSYQPTKEDMQSPSEACQKMAKWMRTDIAKLHQYEVPMRINYSDKADPEHMLMDRKCHVTLGGYHPPGIDPSELHFHVMNYRTGRLGCNGGCGSNGGKGFRCTNVGHLRDHIETCEGCQNWCRTCDAKCDSTRALSAHECICESDEEFNAKLEKVRRLLPPGRKWENKFGFARKIDANLFEWLKRKVEGSNSVGSVGGERRKKLEALGYTEKRGFFLS